jgi:hypothetical protein
MRHAPFSVASLVGLAALGLAPACGSSSEYMSQEAPRTSIVASDGQAYPDTMAALRASGAHDLQCPAAQVNAQSRRRVCCGPEYFVEGCGKRAFYVLLRRDSDSAHDDCLLQSIVPLAPASAP